ncbi:MAG: hypothetical protein R3293_09690 [Candidatus Promineifilaceae bacterium]|nr:hypothetical protein [Candidatus Promineifilaceae bacterium]
MTIREKRPFPVPSEVVMRSALFTLANMNARLQVYNEETGVIVAGMPKMLGLRQQEVIVRVRRFDQTSILELEAPDTEKAQQMVSQISAYVTDGAGRVQADATIQWVDIVKKKQNREKRARLANRARALLPGDNSEGNLPAVVDDQGMELISADGEEEAAPLIPIPDNPGVLVKNQQDKVIELKVDPAIFTDRTPYLEVCQACSATVMRSSKYCSSCGRPLTLEAVQPELQNAAGKAARNSMQAGLIAIAATLIPFLILILPQLLGPDVTLSFLEKIGQSLTPIRLALSIILGVLPSLAFGWWAVSQARQAAWYQNLEALFDEPGRFKAGLGRVLGWAAIYICLGWILFVLVALLFG